MKRGKQYPQKILWIQTDKGKTNRGNPRTYWYLLGCGHVQMEPHNMRTFFDYMMTMKPEMGMPYVEKNCRRCPSITPDDKPTDRYPLGFVREVFGSAGDRVLEIHRESGLLIDEMPREAVHSVSTRDKVYKHLHQKITKTHHSGDLINDPITPFKHKYVYKWWELENGYAVGFNENPSLGWSFPVMKIKEEWNYE